MKITLLYFKHFERTSLFLLLKNIRLAGSATRRQVNSICESKISNLRQYKTVTVLSQVNGDDAGTLMYNGSKRQKLTWHMLDKLARIAKNQYIYRFSIN